jgi:hypothetical protein
MGKHYVVLSFFKTRKIDYVFNADEMTIVFPCPHCWENTTMDAVTSEWKCLQCKEDGNIFDLIHITKLEPISTKVDTFDPVKERAQINKKFEKILGNPPKEKLHTLLIEIQHKVNAVLDFYIK